MGSAHYCPGDHNPSFFRYLAVSGTAQAGVFKVLVSRESRILGFHLTFADTGEDKEVLV